MWKKPAIILLLILLLCSSIKAAAAADEIAISVATDKTAYDYGEPIQVAITARNITDHPVTLSWPTSCQSRYLINGGWHTTACLEVLTSLTIDVGQAHTWTFSHPVVLAPGFYVIVGQVIDYGDSQPRVFTVGNQVVLPIVVS